MTFADSALRWQRWLVAAMLFGSAVIILPPAVEPFMLPKATFVVVVAVALAALVAARAVWGRAVHLPSSPAVWAVAAFAVALVVTTVTSPTPWASLIGFYGRYTGLVPYLCYLLVFLVVLRATDLDFVRLLTRTALAAAGVVVLYGLLQAVGAEPFGFEDEGLGSTFSFFGNVNFSAAWAGAVTGLALVVALDSSQSRSWRVYAAVLVPLLLVYTVVTQASQGVVVAVLSLGWAGLVLATAPGGRARAAVGRRRTAFLAAAAGVVVLVAVAFGLASPFLRAQLDQALVERPQFWSAALAIFRDNPVLGTGLDTYAHHFLAYRPASHALQYGAATTDAPHSVPLGMLSNGGLLLGLAHLAVVLTVGIALVRGISRASGSTRLALAGWGAVWLGYQAQSLVSFDVPPLAVLHWVSAGLIVALAAPPQWRRIGLPGAAPARKTTRTGKEYGDPLVPLSTRGMHGALVVLSLAVLWFAAYPLRADLRAASAAPLASAGKLNQAVRLLGSAADLNPGEASYAFLAARGHEAAKRPRAAIELAAEAARRDPGTVQYALFAARQARGLDDAQEARRWYDEAVTRDPKDPLVLNEVAAYLVAAGDRPGARALFQRTLAVDPQNADARNGLAGLPPA